MRIFNLSMSWLAVIALLCVMVPPMSEAAAGGKNSKDSSPKCRRGQTSATYFRDADLDGFGIDQESLVACEQPEGYAAVGGDCADGDATQFPGAIEQCDGLDNNCDGQVDENIEPVPSDSGGMLVCQGAAGFVLECSGGETACGEICVDLASDQQHCGGCGNLCGGGDVCSAGACVPAS